MMSKGKRILDILTNENPDAIIYDGMDDALIGIYRGDLARPEHQKNAIAIYSYVKFIEIYIKRDGMSEEEAVEFFDYNVARGYIGELQPIVIDDTGV
jgi:hypothetical protein